MKRILIFSTAYDPFIGGAEVAVKEITERMTDVEFVMITARLQKDLKEREQIGNIDVHRIGNGNTWDKFRLMFFGWKKAQELGTFDLAWSIMASYAGFAALRYKKKHKSVPFLLTLQEGDSKWHIYKHVWFVWPWFKQIFKRADKIQAISQYLARWGREMGARCDIEVVPNGINRVQIADSTEHKDKSIKRVITVSRLVKKNGVEYLIRAIKILEEKHNLEVVLKVLGDGELKKKLKELVKELNIGNRVVVLGKKEFKVRGVEFTGEVSNKEVYDRLKQADVFCRPSLSEGLGNAFLEAMAMEVPVIATPVGGIPDFLEDGKTGWFCKVKDPESIAEKIMYILDETNKEKVEEVVQNARKMVQETYSWDLIAKKMKYIFNSLCAS